MCRRFKSVLDHIKKPRFNEAGFFAFPPDLSNTMIISTLKELYLRDLNRVKTEIQSYQHPENIWKLAHQIPNTAGNLCLHLVGNLNTFIGAELGNTGYIRHRELEFSLKDVPRDVMIRQLDDTLQMIAAVMDSLSDDVLAKEYRIQVFDHPMTTGYFLVHLATHLSYHLGQINYHRRLLDLP